MRRLDTKAFNKTLREEMENLKEMAGSITAENIKYFPESLLNNVSSTLDIWGDEATINSVKYQKLRSLIDHLRINKLEYKTISGSVGVLEEKEIEVPKGFDGRNSFVKLSCIPNGKKASSLTNIKKAFSDWYESTEAGVIKAKQRLAVHKNKLSIDIEFDISSELDAYGDIMLYDILLWRTK